ncbi:MAG: bifunctional tetrahydrofolate synthase/dihydrofolate synthase [Burkholderiales bacterium]
MPLPADLDGWLAFVERLHPSTIALGLERVRSVLARLAIPKSCPIVVVGGTNGKGSTCALLEAMLGAAGYRVGCYTSPHLLRYAERVRVAGRELGDAALVAAFAEVERARRDTPLTYFEFGTLAAWVAFARARLEALVLEIGLGGRLDAVNAFEPDCAILTGVDLDHMDYLGATRERIGWEKAHIFRPGRPAIVGDPNPPATVIEHARGIGAQLLCIGRDFGYEADRLQWRYWGPGGTRAGLAHPALRGAPQLANAATAITAVDSLRGALPVPAQAIRDGLARAELPGRFQVLPGRPTVILDVAHNPQAAAVLAANLADMGPCPRTLGVVGMLRDKDLAGVVGRLAGHIDRWYAATLDGPRGATAEEVAAAIGRVRPGAAVERCASPRAALAAAEEAANQGDRIVVFGSFLTVADVMAARAAPFRPVDGR